VLTEDIEMEGDDGANADTSSIKQRELYSVYTVYRGGAPKGEPLPSYLQVVLKTQKLKQKSFRTVSKQFRNCFLFQFCFSFLSVVRTVSSGARYRVCERPAGLDAIFSFLCELISVT